MLCDVMLHRIQLYSIILCHIVLYHTILYHYTPPLDAPLLAPSWSAPCATFIESSSEPNSPCTVFIATLNRIEPKYKQNRTESNQK